MKNLKKVLSLVLALSMALSLMTVAFAADAKDYVDYDKVQNTEAVSVLSALNVIDGKDGNKFDPNGTVTRAEMAKMITVIALGDVDVSAFKGTTTDLKDVNGWYEAYVKYCYSQGIISGRGNGIFDPLANVTAAEAAKMLLVTIGYNAKVQGYEGAAWKINTVRDAQTSGFFADLSVTSDKALTRDEAAQMIYNAVDATMIRKTSSVDRTDGSIIDSYAPYADGRDLLKETFKVTTDKVDLKDTSYDSEKDEYTYTLSANVNGSTSITADADYSDLFGMNVKVMWTEDKSGETVVYGIYANKSKVLAEGVFGDIDTTDIADNKMKLDSTEYKTETKNATFYVADNNAAELDAHVADTGLKGYYGVKLIDKDGNGKVDFVVYTPATIAKVTYVGKTNITLNGDYGATTLSVKDDVIYKDIAKDDYVVVTAGLESNEIVEKLDTKFTAKITKISAYDKTATTKAVKLVAGNETYKVADIAKDAITVSAIGKDMTAVVYNGYLFYTDTSSTIGVDKFAMVINAEKAASGLNKHPQAELLFTDGSKKVVDVAADYASDGNKLINKMVTFSVTDDVYTLKNATGAAGTDFATNGGYAGGTETYNKNTGKTTNGYTVSDTAVIFSKDSKGNWMVSTGADVKKGNNSITQGFYKTSSATGYSAIELGVVNAEIAVSNSNYAVVTSSIATVNDKDDNKVAELTIWTANGAQTVMTTNKYNASEITGLAKGDVIAYTDEGDGVITVDEEVSMTESAVVAYNPVANSDGEYDISFAGGTASDGTVQKATATSTTLIDKDTVVLYIDRSGKDYTGIEGGEIRLATETATSGTFYTNVAYNGSTNVKVLVIEVDNNFSDVTM